jgi:hypothetical protein
MRQAPAEVAARAKSLGGTGSALILSSVLFIAFLMSKGHLFHWYGGD